MPTFSTSPLEPPPPLSSPQRQQHEQQGFHQPEVIADQTLGPAMTLIKDHTQMVTKSLASIKFKAIETLNPKLVPKQKETAVMLITIGAGRTPPAYCEMKFELVGVLAKWMYSDLAISTTKVRLQMLPEAAHDPEMEERVITAFEELRGMQKN
ncbi:MAG: hypothetical protein Q9169_002229 [Polycauliona sp. 2 TL-2023]